MTYVNKLTFTNWCDHMGYLPIYSDMKADEYQKYLFSRDTIVASDLPPEFDTDEPHLASWMQE